MWFKVTDTLPDTRAVEDAMERCPWAMSLWLLVGCTCAQKENATGGVVTPDLLRGVRRGACLTAAQVDEAVAVLVEVGLWHDPKTLRRCDDCAGALKLKAGSFFFHCWWDGNPPGEAVKVPQEFRMWKLRDDLKRDRKLCGEVDARDKGLCRYCGGRVRWEDRKGATGATRDHIDPYGGNTHENVVVACRLCNGRKGHRTPEQWVAEDGLWDEVGNPSGGRLLLPPPTTYTPSPDLVPDQVPTGPDPGSRAHLARDGAGRDGTGPGLVHDQIHEEESAHA